MNFVEAQIKAVNDVVTRKECSYCTRDAEYCVESELYPRTLYLCYLDKYFYLKEDPTAKVFKLNCKHENTIYVGDSEHQAIFCIDEEKLL